MKRQAIFVSEIEDDKCYIHIYQNFEFQKTFVGVTPDDVWKKSGFIQKFSGMQLFRLEDQITQQKLYNYHVSQCFPYKWDNFGLMNSLYEYHLQRWTSANVKWYNLFTKWAQNKHNIIELGSELKLLYSLEYQFSDHEFNA